MSPQGCSLRVWPATASGQEGPCVLVLEPSWHDVVVTIMSPPLGTVVALIEDLACPITAEEGFERNAAWSARRGAWCAQEALLLKGTCLQVTAYSLLRRDGRTARCVGLGLGSKLGLARHGVGRPPDH